MSEKELVTPPKHLPTAASLCIDDVSKSFAGVRALKGVSLEVRAGEVLGLVGENGAGKSTLMAIASGALAPDSGSVSITGERLVDANPEEARRRGLAIVRQEPALMPDLTVGENLYLGVQKSHRPSSQAMTTWARQCLKSWDKDISIDPSTRVDSLVPEEKFIVEISKALAQSPDVLVLDEPTEHLSTEDVQRLFARIRDLTAAGCAVVYISHRVHEVRQIADRVTILRDGRVQGTHATEDLDESKIVNLIVGRSVASAFPDKPAHSESGPTVLEVTNLRGNGFSDISMTIRQGEVVGLAGIEGNGQREFMRALAGLNRGRGTVKIGSTAISIRSATSARDAGVAYVPADRHHEGIAGSLSVRENLNMRSLASYASLGFLRRSDEDDAARRAISSFRIKTPTMQTPISSLSGGNQQKVVLASVLATEPRVLLADEPSQGVDVGARLEIYELIRSSAASGTAVLVVSADAAQLAGLCDRVIIFSRGTTVAELAGADVSERDITRAVLTSTAERVRPQRASRLVRWLAGSWAPPISVATAVLALGIWASLANNNYLSGHSISVILSLTATLALAACGQQLALTIGGIDLSVGPLMGGLVVIESYFLVDNATGLTQAFGWFLLFGVAICVGVVNWVLIDLVKLQPMIATLVTYTALQGLSLTLRPVPGGVITTAITDPISTQYGAVPVIFIIAVVLALGLELVLFRSHFGIALRGLGSKPEAARVAGVVPHRVHFFAYIGCSLFAALAAIPLLAQVGSGDPASGISYTIGSIAAVVIGGASVFGGRASFVGAFLAALLIGQIDAVTSFLNLSEAWSSYLLGGMMIVGAAAYSKSRQLALPR
ncbi:ATP-binding cassette domain-containing protein [Amycolatopsis pithecellobii]|uniref:ATP-binding cassette domain-containing protein n=1 Tax=Amycolatopsis pithecellobii TaxID=664692 RepID=A0A6N7ZCI5_9PSEU|nr:ATP-binding cassette domain-containing protein [Amycolatopsis pithecellobii]MTD59389.1 ATP-binding cassette domain-containing protein [Amycolatopsis pithecellobii]